MVRGVDITERPSPNHDQRSDAVAMIVLHYTGMPTLADSLDRLRSPAAEVSCHYVVAEDGEVFRLVAERNRAWHAGSSFWRGARDVNGISIGIELQNPGHEWGYRDFPDTQIISLITLIRDIGTRHQIPGINIVGHSDIAPDRKRDPGDRFPWQRLADAGIGVWSGEKKDVEARQVVDWTYMSAVMAIQDGLIDLGFDLRPTGTYCDDTKNAVTAFQSHWQQSRTDGMADSETAAILARLNEQV